MAHTLAGTDQLPPQLLQIAAANVGQLHSLQIVPDAFIGIEIRCVARQLLQVESPGRSSLEEVLDCLSSVNRRTIPDEQELARDLAQEDTKKAYHFHCIVGTRTHLQKQPPIGSNTADRREVIVRERDTQNRGLSMWCPSPYCHWQEIKARFVYPDDGPFFFLSFFLMAGQRLSYQSVMAASSRCVARSMGCCRLHPASRSRRLT